MKKKVKSDRRNSQARKLSRKSVETYYSRISLKKATEVTTDTILSVERVIDIAVKYHKIKQLEGTVNTDIKTVLYDEAYTFYEENNLVCPAWRVRIDLEPNPFLFEDYTFVVADSNRILINVLNSNGHPVADTSLEVTEEEIPYLMDEKM